MIKISNVTMQDGSQKIKLETPYHPTSRGKHDY